MEAVERFDSETMRGGLLEAEHVARYSWAAALVRDKRVLDAGCGTGYGSVLLAQAGAAEVVGVDIDADALEVARRSLPESVTLETADVLALPAELGEFDVIVCFEVIEHTDEPDRVLDQLAGTLRPSGILVISSPNRDVYPPGNPYHKHEFRPEELAEALAARFPHVRILRQQDWLATGIFDNDDFARLDALRVPVAKAVAGEPGTELYSVAVASASLLPPTPPFVMLTRTTDLKWWQERLQGLREEVDAEKRRARGLEVRLQEQSAELQAAHGVISSMQATRAWRLGTRYWRLRDRLLSRAGRRG